MTNQPNRATTVGATWNLEGAWPATFATFCATALLLPFACSQFGRVGAISLGVFAAAIITSTWASSLLAALVAVNHPKLSALTSSSGVRMIAPLIVAVIIATTDGQLAPVETLYYLVPLFMCSLAADVASHVRKLRHANAIPASAVAPATSGAL